MDDFKDVAHRTVVELFDLAKEQQAEIKQLKAQLNNMEACYIEKKKQVEAVSQVHAELEALKAEDERNYIECCKSNS